MNRFIIPNGVEAVFAEYHDGLIDEYKNNPFIEALPQILSRDEVIEKLASYPKYNTEERNLSNQYRLHIVVQRLLQLFQPLSLHLELENTISTMIRTGYVSRNPIKKEYTQMFINGYRQINKQEIDTRVILPTTACSLSIIGVSGMGKSTSINRILSNIPQVICHKNYKGINFNFTQVCWIKLDCSYDGSVKGLCIDFFAKVDALLGTNYFIKYGTSKRTVDTLLSIMAQVSRNIGLGLLIIDEIQHLSMAKSGGSDKMLNFFTTMVNVVNIPLIMVGTMKARSILQSDFRIARRGLGTSGNLVWERMKKDENWDLMVEAIWEYQWTKKPTQLDQQYTDLLYDLSQGVIDIAIKIYCMAQVKAISTGIEEITLQLIKQVAEENLKMIQPMLDALKSGDYKKIAIYEDICTVDLEKFLSSQKNDIDFTNKIKEFKDAKKQREKSIQEEAVFKLIELDIKEFQAKETVSEIIKEFGEDISLREIITKALAIIEIEQINKKKCKPQDKLEADDIRSLVEAGLKENKTAYEALKERGYIVSADCDWTRGEVL